MSADARQRYNRQYFQNHREELLKENRARGRLWREQRRRRILDRFGGKCAWPGCEWTDVRALQIDHINGGGHRQRQQMGSDSVRYFQYVEEHPQEFQILCANHNWIKHMENESERGRLRLEASPREPGLKRRPYGHLRPIGAGPITRTLTPEQREQRRQQGRTNGLALAEKWRAEGIPRDSMDHMRAGALRGRTVYGERLKIARGGQPPYTGAERQRRHREKRLTVAGSG